MPKNPLRFRANLQRIEAGGGPRYIHVVLCIEHTGPARKLGQEIGKTFSVLMLDDNDQEGDEPGAEP